MQQRVAHKNLRFDSHFAPLSDKESLFFIRIADKKAFLVPAEKEPTLRKALDEQFNTTNDVVLLIWLMCALFIPRIFSQNYQGLGLLAHVAFLWKLAAWRQIKLREIANEILGKAAEIAAEYPTVTEKGFGYCFAILISLFAGLLALVELICGTALFLIEGQRNFSSGAMALVFGILCLMIAKKIWRGAGVRFQLPQKSGPSFK